MTRTSPPRRAAALLAGLCLAGGLAAQQPPPPSGGPSGILRVFLDCNTFCDFDNLRREITYVNWVRDRADADVHLIVTSQTTGGGGRAYDLRFLGLNAFNGLDDQLAFATRQSDTEDEIRTQLVERIGLGLARYVARGPLAARIRLQYRPPEGIQPAAPERDPWNFWVFTTSVEGFFFGQSQVSESFLSGSVRARRVTEHWRLNLGFRGNRSRSRFTLEDGEVFRSRTSSYGADFLLVRTVGRHWAVGINANARRSSVNNYDLLTRVQPGIEYNIFPYSESSRREFVLAYEVGVTRADYREETVFSKLEETRLRHAFTTGVEAVQPWGSVEAGMRASAYLDDWSQNRLEFEAGLNFRVVRGLSLNLNGRYTRIRDQLSLAKEGATDEEVFLRLQQLRTGYSYHASIGLSYTFGSKFNNIVNPRFNLIDDFDF